MIVFELFDYTSRSVRAEQPLTRWASSEHVYESLADSDSDHTYCEPIQLEPVAPLRLNTTSSSSSTTTTTTTSSRTTTSRASGHLNHADQQLSLRLAAGSATMYTNAANLRHTIQVQQQLFRQSLQMRSVETPKPSSANGSSNKSANSFTPAAGSATPAPADSHMEWKVF